MPSYDLVARYAAASHVPFLLSIVLTRRIMLSGILMRRREGSEAGVLPVHGFLAWMPDQAVNRTTVLVLTGLDGAHPSTGVGVRWGSGGIACATQPAKTKTDNQPAFPAVKQQRRRRVRKV